MGRDSRAGRRRHYGPAPWKRSTCSRISPTGVPPLALTGERTLPDVPEENYWFRRHLAVYEWIAERVAGCGRRPRLRRGLRLRRARRPRRGGGRRRRQPRCPRARQAALPAPEPALRARPSSRSFDERCDAIVFLQTIEHIHEPGELLAALRASSRRSPTSPPRTGSRSPPRAPRSPTTPGTCASTPPPSTASWSRRISSRSSSRRLSRRQAARCTSSPSGSAGTACTRRCGSPKPLLRLLRARDRGRRLRAQARRPSATSTGRSTSSPSAGREPAPVGDPSRSSSTATCPTSRASAPTRSARNGCSTP